MDELGEARKRVGRYIDESEGEMIAFLSEYIRHRSVNAAYKDEEGGGEKTCQTWLKETLTSWGAFDKVDFWEGERDRPNIVASVHGEAGEGRSLMFNGHSDVVPVLKEQLSNWTVDPWGGEVRDGRVYGRGATDMKGGNAAFVWATRAISESGIKLRGSVFDALTIGEESSQHEIGVDSVMDRGYKPEFLINAEATNMRICPVGLGLYVFKLRVPGKGAHASMKYRSFARKEAGSEWAGGVNAIDKALKIMLGLQELERRWLTTKRHKLMPAGASNITASLMRAGEYVGRIPESCELTYLVWTSPDETPEESVREVRGAIDRIVEGDEWLRAHPPVFENPTPEVPENWRSYSTPLDHPGVVALADSYSSVLGEVEWGCFTAVGEVVWMVRKGTTGVILGPGELTMGAHGDDEYVPVRQVVDCCKVYAEMILRWCGVSQIQGT